MRGDILGRERRRRWGEEEKLEIVLSVGVDGASVTQVAQRHDVTRQQIYAWRHEWKKKGLLSALPEALFLPVEFDRPTGLAMPAVATQVEGAHSTEGGHRFHAKVGTRSTASWAAIPREGGRLV